MFLHQPTFHRALRPLIAGAIGLAVGYAASAQAQVAPPARALLDGYVSEAIRANLALAQQRAQLDRAEAAVREARGRFLPSLELNARYSEISGVVNIGDFINPAYGALNQLIGQPQFPTEHQRDPAVQAGIQARADAADLQRRARAPRARRRRAQRDLVGAGRRTAMRQLAADVQLSWLGYAGLDRAVATLESTLPLLDENLRVSARLIEAGQATPDALLRARAERSELPQQLEDTRRQRDAARRGFNLLRDRDADAPIDARQRQLAPAADTLSLAGAGRTRHARTRGTAAGRQRHQARRRATSRRQRGLPAVAWRSPPSTASRATSIAPAPTTTWRSPTWSSRGTCSAAARPARAASRPSPCAREADARRREAERAVRLQVENAYDAVQAARVALDHGRRSPGRRRSAPSRWWSAASPKDWPPRSSSSRARSAFTAAAINQILTRITFASRVVELERAAALRPLPE